MYGREEAKNNGEMKRCDLLGGFRIRAQNNAEEEQLIEEEALEDAQEIQSVRDGWQFNNSSDGAEANVEAHLQALESESENTDDENCEDEEELSLFDEDFDYSVEESDFNDASPPPYVPPNDDGKVDFDEIERCLETLRAKISRMLEVENDAASPGPSRKRRRRCNVEKQVLEWVQSMGEIASDAKIPIRTMDRIMRITKKSLEPLLQSCEGYGDTKLPGSCVQLRTYMEQQRDPNKNNAFIQVD